MLHPRQQHDRAHERLIAEARALARLDHPNVVKVHDVLTHADQLVIVMAWVEGETLATWEQRAPRTWREVLPVYLQAGQGLAAAHGVGVIHRDFKPANAIFGTDGQVRVLDFGLARSADAPAEVPPAVMLARAARRSDDRRRARELLRGTQAMGWVAAFQGSPWSAQEAWIRQFVEEATGWKLGTAGACGWASDFGLYLGRPATYKANARYTIVDSDAGTRTVARRQVDVDPMISFGVTYSPVSEVRLMAGLTLSNAVLETDGPSSHMWALTFAVGGNLDIVGALIPQ